MLRKILYLSILLLFSLHSKAENTMYPLSNDSDFDITHAGVKFPRIYELWDLHGMIGFSVVKPPYDWLENAYQAPYFDIRGKLGLPENFSLEGEFQSLIVSNLARLGPHYTYEIGNFSFDIGYELGWAFGKMDIEKVGFDNSMSAWFQYPRISAGYKFSKDIAITFEFEYNALLNLKMRAGDQVVTSTDKMSNGTTLGLYVEQRLFKNYVMIVGAKNNYTKFYYLTWPAFTTFNRYYNIPELYFGFIL